MLCCPALLPANVQKRFSTLIHMSTGNSGSGWSRSDEPPGWWFTTAEEGLDRIGRQLGFQHHINFEFSSRTVGSRISMFLAEMVLASSIQTMSARSSLRMDYCVSNQRTGNRLRSRCGGWMCWYGELVGEIEIAAAPFNQLLESRGSSSGIGARTRYAFLIGTHVISNKWRLPSSFLRLLPVKSFVTRVGEQDLADLQVPGLHRVGRPVPRSRKNRRLRDRAKPRQFLAGLPVACRN
jgi:hypothetical protein